MSCEYQEGGEAYEDKIDTGPLLKHLQGHAKHDTTEVTGRIPSTSEAVCPAGLHVCHLVLVVFRELVQLILDILRVDRLAAQSAERASGILMAAALDIPTRRLGQQEETGSKDESEEPLDRHGDAVGAGVHAVLGGIVDHSRKKQADGDTEL
jgi:hypothetical protein